MRSDGKSLNSIASARGLPSMFKNEGFPVQRQRCFKSSGTFGSCDAGYDRLCLQGSSIKLTSHTRIEGTNGGQRNDMTADEENRERCPDSIFPLHLHMYVSSALLLSKADYESKRTKQHPRGPHLETRSK